MTQERKKQAPRWATAARVDERTIAMHNGWHAVALRFVDDSLSGTPQVLACAITLDGPHRFRAGRGPRAPGRGFFALHIEPLLQPIDEFFASVDGAGRRGIAEAAVADCRESCEAAVKQLRS